MWLKIASIESFCNNLASNNLKVPCEKLWGYGPRWLHPLVSALQLNYGTINLSFLSTHSNALNVRKAHMCGDVISRKNESKSKFFNSNWYEVGFIFQNWKVLKLRECIECTFAVNDYLSFVGRILKIIPKTYWRANRSSLTFQLNLQFRFTLESYRCLWKHVFHDSFSLNLKTTKFLAQKTSNVKRF